MMTWETLCGNDASPAEYLNGTHIVSIARSLAWSIVGVTISDDEYEAAVDVIYQALSDAKDRG